MKKCLLLFIFLFSLPVISQQNTIDKNKFLPKEIDYKGSVQKITIKNFRINKKEDKIDTVLTISEVNFSKKGKITVLKNYNKSTADLWRIVKFDDLERITGISFKKGDEMVESIKQYFSNTSEFPDSCVIDTDPAYKEKYLNIFDKNLVVKQDHFVNTIFQDSRSYKYNSDKQLIEEFYYNPKNETDKTMTSTETDEGYKLSFFPEQKIMYEYQKNKDTSIVIKIRPTFSIREITKTVKKKNFEFELSQKYEKDFFSESTQKTVFKDSISYIHLRYDDKKQVKSYYNTYTNSKSVVSKSGGIGEKESIYITNITIAYDKKGNWIKKAYSNNGVVNYLVEREIEY